MYIEENLRIANMTAGNVAPSTPTGLNIGGTGQDFSATGGAHNFLAQAANSVVSSRAITSADLPAALADVATLVASGQVTTSVLKTSTALVATGGGATAPVLATAGIAQAGQPTTAAQAGWIKMKDSTNADIWIPVWK